VAKRKRPATQRATKAAPRRSVKRAEVAASTAEDDQIAFSSLSLHDLFQQQTMQLLDRTDLDEEQKQSILVAVSCPCCGAGGMSYTVKIKRRP
jgi:hypothetical protein